MTRQKRSLARRVGNAALVVLVIPLVLPLALLSLTLYFLYRASLYLLVWLLWLPKGKDILFVYSDSPIWCEYMISKVLPLVRDRAVVLNWSERSKWSTWSLRVSVFRHFGGGRDYNPMVIKFQPFHAARILRYWSAFQDRKRGYTGPVEKLYDELTAML